MNITRREAKMIAEEVYKLFKHDGQTENGTPTDELLTIDQAAQILKCSKHAIYHNIRLIPHTKVGNRLRFTHKSLLDYAYRLK